MRFAYYPDIHVVFDAVEKIFIRAIGFECAATIRAKDKDIGSVAYNMTILYLTIGGI